MTDNLNLKTSSAVDNGKKAAHAGHSDAKGSTQTTHKDVSADPKFNPQNTNNDTSMKSQDHQTHDKSSTHKDVSVDPKFNTQNKHNDTGMKNQNASGHEQSGSHKDVSADPKFNTQNKNNDTGMKHQNA